MVHLMASTGWDDKLEFTLTVGPYSVEGDSLVECWVKLDSVIRKDAQAALAQSCRYSFNSDRLTDDTWMEK